MSIQSGEYVIARKNFQSFLKTKMIELNAAQEAYHWVDELLARGITLPEIAKEIETELGTPDNVSPERRLFVKSYEKALQTILKELQ